ncbi:MAG: TetR/AcrR family transcriptional regulator [Actinobacteria bacterium]|nr:TetR/AcrR family transcriptional regulator [Actinomycetota bacterium]
MVETTRKRRSDGEKSRKAILSEAAQLATVEGINGLSIGRLADAVGMSKSGLFAHFGSKEDLQLATIETARALFHELVIEPALVGTTALGRLRLLIELFLRHVEDKVYPGGCFYVSVGAELGAQSGPVRDQAVALSAEWMRLVVSTIREAQAEGHIDAAEDAEQLAFELTGYLLLGNTQFVATQDSAAIERARHAVEGRLAAATRDFG